MKKFHFPRTRLIAALLALVCVLGLLPGTALAATPDTIKMDDCTHNGVKYESPALGTCHLHQMHFGLNGKSTMGFCAEKGKGMVTGGPHLGESQAGQRPHRQNHDGVLLRPLHRRLY